MNTYVSLSDLPRRDSRRRVICGCMFHNELSALDWRVHELESVVDDFVVVESTLTHSGLPRNPVRPDQDPRFARLGSRFKAVVVHDSPTGPDPWERERSQRLAIWTRAAALTSTSDDDLIIISDVDEVPFPETVSWLAARDFETPIRVRPHWFNFDWSTYLGLWAHASILFYPAGYLRQAVLAGNTFEISSGSLSSPELKGVHGWHASWFGSDDFILDKLVAYSHANDDKDLAALHEGLPGIQERRKSGFDMYRNRKSRRDCPRLPDCGHLVAPLPATPSRQAQPEPVVSTPFP